MRRPWRRTCGRWRAGARWRWRGLKCYLRTTSLPRRQQLSYGLRQYNPTRRAQYGKATSQPDCSTHLMRYTLWQWFNLWRRPHIKLVLLISDTRPTSFMGLYWTLALQLNQPKVNASTWHTSTRSEGFDKTTVGLVKGPVRYRFSRINWFLSR